MNTRKLRLSAAVYANLLALGRSLPTPAKGPLPEDHGRCWETEYELAREQHLPSKSWWARMSRLEACCAWTRPPSRARVAAQCNALWRAREAGSLSGRIAEQEGREAVRALGLAPGEPPLGWGTPVALERDGGWVEWSNVHLGAAFALSPAARALEARWVAERTGAEIRAYEAGQPGDDRADIAAWLERVHDWLESISAQIHALEAHHDRAPEGLKVWLHLGRLDQRHRYAASCRELERIEARGQDGGHRTRVRLADLAHALAGIQGQQALTLNVLEHFERVQSRRPAAA